LNNSNHVYINSGHCKKLAPEYEQAAEALAKNDPPFFLAKVDSTEQKKISEEFGIQGFPTLKWFHNGEPTDYQGGRTGDAIVSWILKKTGPPSTELTCDALKEKTAADKFVIAFFGANLEDALYTEAHVKMSESEEKIAFVHNLDAACATEFGATQPSLVFFRQFEEKVVVYTGAADKEALLTFVKPLMVPTVFAFTEDEIEAVFGQQQDCLILFRKEEDNESAFQKVFEEAAVAFKGKILFSYAGSANQIQGKLAEFMGVTEEDYPTIRALLPANMKKFQFESDVNTVTIEQIGTFVDGVKDGSIKAHLKSAAVPEEQGNVIVIVGTEYDKIVNDPTKDVLVKFYAPWCGHCKKLAPIWDELGEAFKDQPDVVIAKFDATVNEADGVEIRGYPTLKWFPKGNKEGESYEGERDLAGLKKFIEDNTTAPAAAAVNEEL